MSEEEGIPSKGDEEVNPPSPVRRLVEEEAYTQRGREGGVWRVYPAGMRRRESIASGGEYAKTQRGRGGGRYPAGVRRRKYPSGLRAKRL